MKKLVLKLDIHNKKEKCKVMAKVSGIEGVISVSIDMKEKKMTVTGDVDAVEITSKLRKLCHADIETLGDAKEDKNEDGKKGGSGGDKKPPEVIHIQGPYPWPYHPNLMYSVVPEENPHPCVIC